MKPVDWLARDGQRLLRMGTLQFLLGLLLGFAVQRLAVPRLGLSAHLLGITQGTFLIGAGLLWPKLELARAPSRLASALTIYGGRPGGDSGPRSNAETVPSKL